MMQDLWLYVSAAGFLVSALLWPYLLLRYRSPQEGAGSLESGDATQPLLQPLAPHAGPVPVISKTPESSRTLPSLPPQTQQAAPPAKIAPPPNLIDEDVPAWTNMKVQLDFLQKELRNVKEELSGMEKKHASEFDVLLNQLGEIKAGEKEMADVKSQVLAAMQRHETQFEALFGQWNEFKSELHRLVEKIAAAQASKAESMPASQAAAAEQQSPPLSESTLVELPRESNAATASSEPASAQAEPKSEAAPEEETQKPKRRGPVWPV